jgi:hypothetical protein
MAKMPPEVRQTLEKQKPIPISTASASGTPNVVFVGLLKIIDDETLMIVDNFFNKTATNLAENPKISLLCFDPEAQRSFQIKGRAEVHRDGQVYDEMRAWVKGVNDKLPASAAVVVKIEAIYNALWGPGAGARIA